MDIHPTFGTSPSVVEVVQMQRPFLSVFSIHPVYDAIFSQADELAIVRFRRTCHPARFAVDDYLVRACNIDKHLSRFFTDTKAFRNLQAQTATVISGSTALQLFLRTTYPGSDLDLYVYPSKAREIGNWLLAAEGYEYVPPSEADHWAASFQKATDEHGELYATLMLLDDDEIVADGEAGDDYSSSAAEIKIVFKFQKVIHGTLDTLRVQMIFKTLFATALVAITPLMASAQAGFCPEASRFGIAIATPNTAVPGDVVSNFTCPFSRGIIPEWVDYWLQVPADVNNGFEAPVLLARHAFTGTATSPYDVVNVTIPHAFFFEGEQFSPIMNIIYPVEGTDGSPVYEQGGIYFDLLITPS
ncbi:hypothetical protein PUNSTDRAFT_143482 [Punctularia strigosozonata HHB-11173 SS5]|uniref:uncharacterized protein n=1 Tax=Punctularia strigosozonata (strain HHB-11173) TaxID=741275 RepID=UPI000441735F|nr:uncharacterized protein PUNSTDRAFT_143482 [Punctularia strigosozonata HHB-11173 SS5]EIN08753.1 hypothetical protein PUNSTDRAFT_143482 [Punctularia strigosozonata HHB-11173 SS5]